MRSEVDAATLVPDPGKTIEQGAVLPWNSGGRRLSMYAARELGVRLDVPYRSLTAREHDIVLHGEPVRLQVTLQLRAASGRTVQLSVNYDNAVAAVERSLRSDNERTRRLVQRFLITRVCSVCHGTRLRPEALTSQLGGRNLAEISALGLAELRGFAVGLPAGLPAELSRMTTGLLAELDGRLTPLLEVGPRLPDPGPGRRHAVHRGAAADRAHLDGARQHHGHALRAGRAVGRAAPGQRRGAAQDDHRAGRERQFGRRGGARAGAHPLRGLGHRARPRGRRQGGTVIAEGTPGAAGDRPATRSWARSWPAPPPCRAVTGRRRSGPGGQITIEIGDLYNLHDLTAAFPVGRLTALAGPSGAGKTALVLDSLIPAARALLAGSALPGHVRRLDLAGIRQVVQIDASPIGQNARSTPATYSGAFDQIRRLFAESAYARRRRWKPGHFSFNTRAASAPPAAGSATSTSTSSTCPTSPSAARPATARASTTPPWPPGSTA